MTNEDAKPADRARTRNRVVGDQEAPPSVNSTSKIMLRLFDRTNFVKL